jgi:glutamine amidotransferase
MIAIIDYGMGNVHSIANMLDHLGIDSIITSNEEDILDASHLILPGVGAFDQAMQALEALGLISVINKFHETQKPMLGICLGMQLLGESSEEGLKPGLGLIPFVNKRFTSEDCGTLRIPHMGWNQVEIKANNQITQNLLADSRFYFVHSYYASGVAEEHIMLTTNYGIDFVSAVTKDNVFGVQFHPEKSHAFGMALLEAFAKVN